MEPVTMALVATVAIVGSTQRPKWEEYLRLEQSPSTIVIPQREVTTAPLIDRRHSVVNAGKPAVNSAKERLHVELMSYVPTGDEDPSMEPVSRLDEILAANEFLQKLPGSIPLPTLMRNDSGDIGMYWDNDLVYIDVDIDSSSTVSLYVRDLATNKTTFLENVKLDEIDAHWFEQNIGETLQPVAALA